MTSIDCPSHKTLDQMQLGELPAAVATAITAHVDACARCTARIKQREDVESEHVLQLALLRQLGPESGEQRTRSRLSRLLPGVGALAAAAAAVVVVMQTPVAAVRTKGAAHATVFVQSAGGVRAHDGHAPVHPGDTVQIAVSASADVWAAVVSKDGAGVVSTYVAPVQVSAGQNVPLPASTVLDATLGAETLAVFLCAQRVDANALSAVIESGEVPGCDVNRTTLVKVLQ
jgi:hypothetical protein